MKPSLLIFGIFAGSLILSPHAYSAMDESDWNKPKCKKGWVYSTAKKKCVKKTSEIIPDPSLVAQGWSLARDGEFERAIEMFSLVSDNTNPEALNGLGFSYRKLGQLDRGIAYYKQALAIDPDYLLAREYLGEGYVSAGKIDMARAQLSEIEKRCGTTCKPYKQLARAIATGQENDW